MKRKITIIVMLCIIGITNLTRGQEVKINTNLAVESNGTIRMDNAAMVWDDLRITLDKGSSAATLTYMPGQTSGGQIYFFMDNATNAMSFTVQLPHSWKEGTPIYPHIHWTPSNNTSGNVIWNLDYTWQNYVSTGPLAFPAPTTSSVTIAVASNSMGKHLITPLTNGNVGLTATGKTISSILVCRIWRNASQGSGDTYQGGAGGLSLDFHFQLDTFGSRAEFSK
jgi:hypothetical protein